MNQEILETGFFILLTGFGWFFAIKMVNNKYKFSLIFLATLQAIYSTYFIYNLSYNSSGGMQLVWGLYFIFFNIGMTLLLSLVGLIFYIKKRNTKHNK